VDPDTLPDVRAATAWPGQRLTVVLLACGVLSPVVYICTDLAAGARYSGYSFAAQAVSELFAIGAPTSALVVPLFTIASLLLLALGGGVWRSSRGRRSISALGLMIAANAVNSLMLWNFFPMHMRGVPPTSTDAMHGILAINPFVMVSIALGIAAFRSWFRVYSIATILVLVVMASIGFSYLRQFAVNEPTPWLGLAERVSQYAHQLWHAVLAIMLMRYRDVTGARARA